MIIATIMFRSEKKSTQQKQLLTSDLPDTLQGVFESTQGAGVALGFALSGKAELQLLDGLH